MKNRFFLLSLGILLLLTVLLILFLGFIGLLDSLVHAVGLSTVIILFLFGFSLLFFALIDRKYVKELHKITESLEVISRNRVDLTYRFSEDGMGETYLIHRGLNEFLSLVHNYIFKMKRIFYRNREIGSRQLSKIAALDKFMKDSYAGLNAALKDGQKKVKHIQSASTAVDDLRSFIEQHSRLDAENSQSGCLYFISRVLVMLEQVDKYIDISENLILQEDAAFTRFAREYEEAMYSIDLINSLGLELQFTGDSVKVNMDRLITLDASTLKSTDGMPLISTEFYPYEYANKPVDLRRPDKPEEYTEDDARRWYDFEYAGWGIEKVNIPVSPADGPERKKVILLRMLSFDHPYSKAYLRGMTKMAGAFGIDIEHRFMPADLDEAAMEAVQDKPDMIIVFSENALKHTETFKKINEADIPVIVSNSVPDDEGCRYIIGACAPDDWGMGRLLARKMAELCGYSGGYCIIRHHPESQAYISRTYSVITELKKIAPEMKCLDTQPSLKKDGSGLITTEWINRFGSDLKMIITSDPGESLLGICEAADRYDRNDILRGTFGNCLISQQLMKEKRLHAMIWQSAEGEGAMALEMAIDWFNGVNIEPIRYLPMRVIKPEDVDSYFPAQW